MPKTKNPTFLHSHWQRSDNLAKIPPMQDEIASLQMSLTDRLHVCSVQNQHHRSKSNCRARCNNENKTNLLKAVELQERSLYEKLRAELPESEASRRVMVQTLQDRLVRVRDGHQHRIKEAHGRYKRPRMDTYRVIPA